MRYLKVLFLFLFFFVAMIFFISNNEVLSQSVSLRFDIAFKAWSTVPLPFYLLILLSFVMGGLFAVVYLFLDKVRLSRDLKHTKNEKKELEEELNSLRNLPLEDKVFSSSSSSMSNTLSTTSSNTLHDVDASKDPMNGE